MQTSASAEVRAFAPGRVNLIGEHTDYNAGLALPFAIAQGVTVSARRAAAASAAARIRAHALDLDERDEFMLPKPTRVAGWRAFVRGTAALLGEVGVAIPTACLQIGGDLPRGAGLSSSAALETALAMALLAIAEAPAMPGRELARLCSEVERDWVGTRSGLLDQLACVFGKSDTALYIDFADLTIEPVPLRLSDGWRLAILDSGEHRVLATSGYNARRAECQQACVELGVDSLRAASMTDLGRLPEQLARRVRHVLEENRRVRETAAALRRDDLAAVGELLNASQASLREAFECSTPAVEATVERLRETGAAGARMIGGGFGGSVLGLFPPGVKPPADALAVRAAQGARLLAG